MPRKRRGPSAGDDTPRATARQFWYCIGTITTRILAVDLLQKQPAQPINSRLGCSVKPVGQPFGTSSHPRRPIAVEDQADGVRAFARRDRRRIASAVSFQCLADRPRVARLPILGLRDEFARPGAVICKPPAACRISSLSPATFCSPSVWLAGRQLRSRSRDLGSRRKSAKDCSAREPLHELSGAVHLGTGRARWCRGAD
jgi:hypothetical protein